MNHKPTHEQQQAIEYAKTGNSFKMTAFAGAGKTSTLYLVAKALDDLGKKGIYLSFNKSIAEEARHKMPPNVFCSTVHSLALRSVHQSIRDKISLPAPNFKTMTDMLGIPFSVYLVQYDVQKQDKISAKVLDDNMLDENTQEVFHRMYTNDLELRRYFYLKKTNGFTVLNHVRNIINLFYSSGENNITSEIVDEYFYKTFKVQYDNPSKYIIKLKSQLMRWATILHGYNMNCRYNSRTNSFEAMNTNTAVFDPHNLYLKVWQLNKPQIKTDFILYDEAQDASGVMLSVLREQQEKGVQVIYVGDPHQQIYEWRGAVNAMEQVTAKNIKLTQSFRFGANVAEVANEALKVMGETNDLTSGKPAKTNSLGETLDDTVHFLPPFQTLVRKDEGEYLVPNTDGFIQWLKSKHWKNQDAIVCRSNRFAFQIAMSFALEGQPYVFNVDKDELYSIFTSVHKLHANRDKTYLDKELSAILTYRCINNYEQLKAHLEDNKNDVELASVVKQYNEFGIRKILEVLSAPDDKNGVHICTMHKSKGLEWDNVIIAPDAFRFMYTTALSLVSNKTAKLGEEYRLYYVAITRPKKVLMLPIEYTRVIRLVSELQDKETTPEQARQKMTDFIQLFDI